MIHNSWFMANSMKPVASSHFYILHFAFYILHLFQSPCSFDFLDSLQVSTQSLIYQRPRGFITRSRVFFISLFTTRHNPRGFSFFNGSGSRSFVQFWNAMGLTKRLIPSAPTDVKRESVVA